MDISSLVPNIRVDRETLHILAKPIEDRQIIWVSDEFSQEKVIWTPELADRALAVTRSQGEDT